jgi:glycosyltransferase involved in cell wall biosynthesis
MPLSASSDDSARRDDAAGPSLHLLVSIPALDEDKTVAAVVTGVPRDIAGVGRIEVLVVDDGSSDRTAQLAAEAGARVIRHQTSRGVGAAFHTALACAIERGVDLLVTIDADGQFDPADIPAVVAPVASGAVDFAMASRFADPALVPDMPRLKRWGNRQVSRLVSRLTGRRFDDVSCGMRCYNRRAMLSLNLMGTFTYVQEVVLNLCFKGLRIAEVPIAVQGEREYGESRVAGNLWRYALNTSRIILRAYRDYQPLRFFGAISLALLAPGVLLELFFFAHYVATGSFSPHKWAGFAGAGLATLSLIVFFMGMIGDMLNRHRVYLEELLYSQRLRNAEAPDSEHVASPGDCSCREPH